MSDPCPGQGHSQAQDQSIEETNTDTPNINPWLIDPWLIDPTFVAVEATLPVPKVGVAAVVVLGVVTVPEVVGAPPVVPLPPLTTGLTALLDVHAPVKVDMAFMFTNAAGVEPQFAACVIQTLLLSRSKTTTGLCQS